MLKKVIVVDDTPENQEMLSMFEWIEYEDGTHIVNRHYLAEWRLNMLDMNNLIDLDSLQLTPGLMSVVNSLTADIIRDMSAEEIESFFDQILEVI